MQKQKGNLIWGILLIVIGLVFFIGNISRVSMDYLWPVFPLAVGIMFLVGYFNDRKNYGLLMPGSILTVVSLLFFYCNFSGWWHMEYLWPIFILAPASGFFAMYFGGNKDQGLLIPGFILAVVGCVFLFLSSGVGDFWPVFLIAAGIIMIVIQFLSDKKRNENSDNK